MSLIDKINPPSRKAIAGAIARVSKWSIANFIIAVISLITLTLCLYVHYSTRRINWDETKKFFEALKGVTDNLKNLVEVVAIVAGALWAYFKYARGRTFQESIEPKVSGDLISVNGATYLVAVAQIKNVGTSDVKIKNEGTGLRMLLYEAAVGEPEIYSPPETLSTSFNIFIKEESIEPNESIEDQKLIAIPVGVELGIRLELYIESLAGYKWRAATIVPQTLTDETKGVKLASKRKGETYYETRGQDEPNK